MATPEMTLWNKADLAITTDSATGRFAVTAGGLTQELGFTGIRDITGNATGITSGEITVARNGNTVTWTLDRVVLASTGATTIIAAGNSALSMFVPPAPLLITGFPAQDVSPTQARFYINGNGALSVTTGTAGVTYSITLTFASRAAWGASLPGINYGDSVVA